MRGNELVVENGEPRVRPTGETEAVRAGLVLRSTGAVGARVDGMPFDAASGRIANRSGAAIDPAPGDGVAGHSCVGWIKRGANGVLGTNRVDAAETAQRLLAEYRGGRLPRLTRDRAHLDAIPTIAERRVDERGWARIDEAERANGARAGRARETIGTWEALRSEGRG